MGDGMSSGIRLKDNFKKGRPVNQVPSEWYNTIARLLNGASCVGGEVTLNPDGMVVNPFLLAAGTFTYRFFCESPLAGTLRVYKGAWTRNGSLAPDGGLLEILTDEDKDYQTVEGIGADDYVWLVLKRSASPDDKDPTLIPNELAVSHGATPPDDFYSFGKCWILGKFTEGKWSQYWTGGDIDDQSIRPDGETASSVEPVRSTIERNTTNNEHQGELQLANVDDAEIPNGYITSSLSVPYVAPDADGGCALAWAVVDGERKEGSFAPYSSLALYRGFVPDVLQVSGFIEGTAPNRGESDTYTLMVREVESGGGLSVRYLDPDTLAAEIAEYLDDDHTDWSKHDGRYWVKGEDQTENYGSAIGDNTITVGVPTPVLAIDLTNRTLKAADGTTDTLDFSAIGAAVDDVVEPGWLPIGGINVGGSDTVDLTMLNTGLEDHGAAIQELQTQVNALLAELRTRKVIATS